MREIDDEHALFSTIETAISRVISQSHAPYGSPAVISRGVHQKKYSKDIVSKHLCTLSEVQNKWRNLKAHTRKIQGN